MFKELLLTFLLLQSRFFSFLVAEIDDDDLELIETPDDEYEDNLASNNSSANSTINKSASPKFGATKPENANCIRYCTYHCGRLRHHSCNNGCCQEHVQPQELYVARLEIICTLN
ncbi:unnamed protein product [Bursaphelenchus xylophilus]|uniref:(pine wood nematode) hypothetical protein n=1 Tax=Bursaphelenchus xylophilus TaxID=6326 RepID=A0A7I8WXQ1_BURXY|nr:unnamed protein product [Bursaphelenchus xylophilus]CAG9100491.1 unnamed protein product [Bursaphelenchus xylophilus]